MYIWIWIMIMWYAMVNNQTQMLEVE